MGHCLGLSCSSSEFGSLYAWYTKPALTITLIGFTLRINLAQFGGSPVVEFTVIVTENRDAFFLCASISHMSTAA